ncbi:MAG: hypothetical protein GWP03_02165 [Proteobacteria bacterium]|nr:hypothetical protein [Pseudomonadota bacterium]
MVKKLFYLLLLPLLITSCNRGKPDVVFSVKFNPYTIIVSTANKIYYIDPDSEIIYKRVNLPHSVERVFEPFPYDKLVLYKSRKIDIFNLRTSFIENTIYARNTAYNLFALNPYKKLIYQSDTDIFLIENNTLYKIAHSDIKIDTSFTFNSGKDILYRIKNGMNYILVVDSMKMTKLGYYRNVVGSPSLHKIYFVDHGILSVYNAKNRRKKRLDIKCSRVILSPATNRLYIISKDNIRLMSTYTNKIVKKIPVNNVENIIFAKDGYQFILLKKDSLYVVDPITDSIKFKDRYANYDRVIALNAKFGYIGVKGNSLFIKTNDHLKKITLTKPIVNTFITEIAPVHRSKAKGKTIKGAKKSFTFYTVQFLSTKNKKHAFAQRDKFIKNGLPAYIKQLNIEDKEWYRLRIGKFNNKSEATLFSVYLTETLNHGCWVTPDTLDSISAYVFKNIIDLNSDGKPDIAFIGNNRKLRIFEINSFDINLIFTSETEFPPTTKLLEKNNTLKLIAEDNIYTVTYANKTFRIIKEQ